MSRYDARALACSFARAVTIESTDGGYGILKNGEGSLFEILRSLLPVVLQHCNAHLWELKIIGIEMHSFGIC